LARHTGTRPQGPFRDKRRTLTTRITDETRTKLDEAAAASGRSLAQEIELRLDRSFTEGVLAESLELSFGRETAAVMLAVAFAMRRVSPLVGLPAANDEAGFTFDAAFIADQGLVAAHKVIETIRLDPPPKLASAPPFLAEVWRSLGEHAAVAVCRDIAHAATSPDQLGRWGELVRDWLGRDRLQSIKSKLNPKS
jgi:hypothetical protein